MPKASFTLPNGTLVTIEGSIEEVENLLNFYVGENRGNKVDGVDTKDKSIEELSKTLTGKKAKPEEADILQLINLIKTCDEADAIEKFILDQTNEANRVLLPLLIVYEHLDNAFGLTTSEISRITIELGAKVSRQNSLRALKYSASGFVMKAGNPPRYTLNRRGLAHLRAIIAGSDNTKTDKNAPTVNLTPKRGRRSKKTSTSKKSPQKLISDLKDNGFFMEKKSLTEVQKKLEEMGFIYAQSSLSPSLLQLVRNKSLKRNKEEDIWFYINL